MDWNIPLYLCKTDLLTMFDFIHRPRSKDLKHEEDSGEVKAKMSYLVNNYISAYKPSTNTLRKHKILKEVKNNKDILTTKPYKDNRVIIVNRAIYITSLYEVINDTSKFKKLPSQPNTRWKGKLQRFLHTFNKKGFFSKEQYKNIYPSGSQQAGLYSNPKTQKLKSKSDKLTFRPIVSSMVHTIISSLNPWEVYWILLSKKITALKIHLHFRRILKR